jgi:hypothetical protein
MKESPPKAVRGESGASYARFREALLDFSEEPTGPNTARYLDASRGLDGQTVRDRPREHRGRISEGSNRSER